MSTSNSVKRGFVFHNEEDALILMTINEELEVTELIITDEEQNYAELPVNKLDVVEINDLGADLGLVGMKSVYSLTFHKTMGPSSAVGAIRLAVKEHPEKLLKLLSENPPAK